MSEDTQNGIVLAATVLGVIGALAYGCNRVQRTDEARLGARVSAPTVTTCVEHSVLDRVQVVQP